MRSKLISERPSGAARGEWTRFAIFIAVGVLNTLVGYALFAGLILLHASPPLAAIGSTGLGILFNFQSIGRLVFSNVSGRILPRFVAVYAVQYAVNLVLLHALSQVGLGALVGQALIAPFLALLTFLLMRRYVFPIEVVSR